MLAHSFKREQKKKRMTIKARETKFRKRWKLKRQLWKKKKNMEVLFQDHKREGVGGEKGCKEEKPRLH